MFMIVRCLFFLVGPYRDSALNGQTVGGNFGMVKFQTVSSPLASKSFRENCAKFDS